VVSLRPLVLTVPMAAPPSSATIETKERNRLRRLGRKVRTRLQANSSVRRIEVENAELWAVPRFLDGVACGRLMTIIDGVAQPSTLHDVDYGRVRSSYSGDIDPGDPFIGALQQRIDDLLGIDPANGETIQGQRYLPGQEFLPHTDWFWPGVPGMGQRMAERGPARLHRDGLPQRCRGGRRDRIHRARHRRHPARGHAAGVEQRRRRRRTQRGGRSTPGGRWCAG
jgi:hypothetical protein